MIIQNLTIGFKRIFRNLYYFFQEGSVIVISKPEILKGYKWIQSSSYGRSYTKGYYEPDLLQCLKDSLKKDSIFFDVGGHAGYVALYGSRLAAKVYTFEPEGSNFLFIKKIIDLNAIDNIFPMQCAVGSKSGKLLFETGNTSSTGKVSSVGTVSVNVVSIDEFMLSNNLQRLDLIKIDVEGFGAEVLLGMTSAIKKFKPIIFFELHNSSELAELKKLTAMAYNFYSTTKEKIDLNSAADQFVIAFPSHQTHQPTDHQKII